MNGRRSGGGEPGGRAPGIVVVVDGPSSVGKSTTVAALQAAWPRVRTGPLLDLGLDQTLASFGPTMLRWWDLVQRVGAGPHGGPDRVVWGPLGRELVAGMHRAAAEWARAGFDVALEHVLLDRVTASDLVTSLAGLPVLHVGLTCDPDVLEDRAADSHTPTGWGAVEALAELAAMDGVAERDLVLDTTEMATEEIVDAVLEAVTRLDRG